MREKSNCGRRRSGVASGRGSRRSVNNRREARMECNGCTARLLGTWSRDGNHVSNEYLTVSTDGVVVYRQLHKQRCEPLTLPPLTFCDILVRSHHTPRQADWRPRLSYGYDRNIVPRRLLKHTW